MGVTRTLPVDVLTAMNDGNQLLTVSAFAKVGFGHHRICALLNNGLIIALAKGVYCSVEHHSRLDAWDEFKLATRAFLLASPDGAVAADWSAAALLDLPTPSVPPKVPSVIRRISRRSGSNRTDHGRTRFAALHDRWITDAGGVPTVHPAVVAVDLGRSVGPEWSLILADAAAAMTGSRIALQRALEDLSRWRGVTRSSWAVVHADPDSESALESAARSIFIRAGLPGPQCNVWLGIDWPVWRVDHYWADQGLIGEADGLAKYGPGAVRGETLQREKDREVALTQWGLRSFRYGWKRVFGQPDVLTDQARSLLAAPVLPRDPRLRCWSNQQGRRFLGLPNRR